MKNKKTYVRFFDGLFRGTIGFKNFSCAMGFIFKIQREERFDKKGRFAKLI